MSDFSLRGGELVDLRAMRMAKEGESEEAWVWKAAQGSRALILDSSGFTAAGERKTYRTLNSAVAADGSLPPEARRAGTFGSDDFPGVVGEEGGVTEGVETAPAYLLRRRGRKGRAYLPIGEAGEIMESGLHPPPRSGKGEAGLPAGGAVPLRSGPLRRHLHQSSHREGYPVPRPRPAADGGSRKERWGGGESNRRGRDSVASSVWYPYGPWSIINGSTSYK